MTTIGPTALFGAFLLTSAALAQTPPAKAPGPLTGTSWQLVKFQSSDDKTLTPDDKTKYSLAFGTDGRVSVRIDCNRGSGTWKSSGASDLQFGPIALTRAFCPPNPVTDRLTKDLAAVRSYILKDGHLFLSLMADGGIYEFEPMGGSKPPAPKSPVTSLGPVTYSCTQNGASADELKATFYRTTPALVLVERNHETRPGFQVRSANGAKYEGPDLMFWDAHGEAQVTWSAADLKCKPR